MLLAAWRDRSEVTDKLLARMTSASRKSEMDIRAVGALQALAGTEDEGLQSGLLKFLDEFLGQPQANQLLLHEMIDAPAEIISAIGKWNRVRRVSIHSIGVGVKEPKAEVFAAFLKDLAETNWGIYKAVN